MQKLKVSTEKKKAWKEFSEYIRRKYADFKGYAKCVTCGVVKHWKELQAGHFVDSRSNTILCDERLVFPQCYACNCMLHGNKIKYFLFMKSLGYTDEQLAEFEAMKHQSKPMKAYEWHEIYLKYKQLNDSTR